MTQTGFYRAMWRWHFYAGLIVLPVLALMAVTGALYLYKPEIEARLYPTRLDGLVGEQLPPSRVIAAVGGRGTVTQILHPAGPQASWQVVTRAADAPPVTHFVDPRTGQVLGDMRDGGVMKTIKHLHSLALTGPVGNRLVEVVAGWAILLCVTGLYLRWPRPGHPALSVRGRAQGRRFWRDLHGTLGFLSAGVILFLAVTGMPWTEIWGGSLRAVVAANQWGRPKMAAIPLNPPAREALPWTLRDAAPGAGRPGDIGIDAVARIAARRGLPSGYQVVLPATPGAPDRKSVV